MTIRHRLVLLVFTFFFSSSGACLAQGLDLMDAPSNVFGPARSMVNAATYEALILSGTSTGDEGNPGGPSSSSTLTAKKLHPYLGYATVLLAGVTAVSSGSKSVHWTAAYGTAGFAALTVTTGVMAHGHRFDLKESLFSEDNLHIILGTLGAAGCIAAVLMADSEGGGSHAGAGVAGGAAMALSIITIRW